jgi:hypothetical protein
VPSNMIISVNIPGNIGPKGFEADKRGQSGNITKRNKVFEQGSNCSKQALIPNAEQGSNAFDRILSSGVEKV